MPNIYSETPDSSAPQQRVKAEMRIRELMAENKIRSVSALHRLLIAKRVTVSHSQLLRIVDNKAEHWKVEFIEAFAELFNCSVQQLFKFELVKQGEPNMSAPPADGASQVSTD
ncbi:helix-turn-helix domain-containing protein [Undibacterium sp. Ji50W]|uniref:helix-turn-helix domain-containing protein n=1 Tax=Undibacterium sp. Ji50W TaxID=3413041 RepID=UPI003BF1CFC8